MVPGHMVELPIFGRISTLRPFFGHFYRIEIDKSKNIWRYGLYKYIGEEKRVKKNLQKKWQVTKTYPLDEIFRILDLL